MDFNTAKLCQTGPPGTPAVPLAAGPIGGDIWAEFAATVPPAVAHIQPATGVALVQMPLVVYATGTAQQWDTVLLGVPITLRATPVRYTWDFGGGIEPVVTTDPGAPYPDHTISHVYRRKGDVAVSLTTTYSGEFSVTGGPWIPIPGTASAASPPIPVHLVEARAELTG